MQRYGHIAPNHCPSKNFYEKIVLFLTALLLGLTAARAQETYLFAHRDSIGIVTDNIVLAGSSAGAIISLAAEYGIVNGKAKGLPAASTPWWTMPPSPAGASFRWTTSTERNRTRGIARACS